MVDDVSFKRIDTQNIYDLQQLFQNDPLSDYISDSPFDLCNKTCLYYEPHAVNNVFLKLKRNFQYSA